MINKKELAISTLVYTSAWILFSFPNFVQNIWVSVVAGYVLMLGGGFTEVAYGFLPLYTTVLGVYLIVNYLKGNYGKLGESKGNFIRDVVSISLGFIISFVIFSIFASIALSRFSLL